jgi:hypothetical protein
LELICNILIFFRGSAIELSTMQWPRYLDCQRDLSRVGAMSGVDAPRPPEPLTALMPDRGGSATRLVQFRCRKDTVAADAATQPCCYDT